MAAQEHLVLPGWTLDEATAAFGGDGTHVVAVDEPDEIAGAVLAALDSPPVAVALPGGEQHLDALVAELRRLGRVRVVRERRHGHRQPDMPDEAAAVLDLVAAGLTLKQAADALRLSRRTADRRMAEARRSLGVETTAEAVLRRRAAAGLGGTPTAPADAPAHLVGREGELRRVVTDLEQDRAVLLVGEGGVGKTALLLAAAAAAGRPVHRAGGLESLRWRTYSPLMIALGDERLEGDAEAVAARVERAVGPDLLVVDDVHLTDPGTQAVLAALVGRVAVAVAARPDRAPDDVGPVATLTEAGFHPHPVEPLSDAAVADLARLVRPDIPTADLPTVLAGAGGLPLLVEFLCRGDADVTRGRGLVPAVDALSPDAAAAAVRLAVAQRPLPVSRAATELVAAGVAAPTGSGALRIRHALVADAVLAAAPADAIVRAHLALADEATDAGTAARHWAAAGRRDRARTAALDASAAAATADESALHLLVAAAASDGRQADDLRLQAATQLSLAGRHAEVLDVLPGAAEGHAEACQLRARAMWHLGDAPAARRTARAGLALAAGTGTATEVSLLNEAVRCELLSLGPTEEHRDMLERADALATRLRRGRAAVLNTRGILDSFLGTADGEAWRLGTAIAAAEGDVDSLMRCSNNLISWHESDGDQEEGLRLAAAMAEDAGRRGLGEWRAQFLAMAGNLLMHRGRYAEALATLDEADAMAADPRTRRQTRESRTNTLAELGLLDAASALLDWRAGDEPDVTVDGSARYLAALVALYSGRPRAALAVGSDELGPSVGHVVAWFGAAVRAWAAYEQRRPVDLEVSEEPAPLARGLRREIQGVMLLPHDPAAAAAHFDEAVRLGRPRSYAPSVRARWAAGEARRLASADDAVDVLLVAEQEAATAGLEPVLVRVHRSLRLAGVRRSAPRRPDRSSLLTEREQEVLDLVARGRSYAEIARRLGVGRPTVRRLLDSARGKLGAPDRLAAAAASPATVSRTESRSRP